MWIPIFLLLRKHTMQLDMLLLLVTSAVSISLMKLIMIELAIQVTVLRILLCLLLRLLNYFTGIKYLDVGRWLLIHIDLSCRSHIYLISMQQPFVHRRCQLVVVSNLRRPHRIFNSQFVCTCSQNLSFYCISL
jgi:hypothetical protein